MIAPGSTSVPVTVDVYDIDSTFDAVGFKNFSLVLSTNENAARITTDTTVVIIFDNDRKFLANSQLQGTVLECLLLWNSCLSHKMTSIHLYNICETNIILPYFSWMVLVLPPAVDITTPASVQNGEPVIFRCTVSASLANITVFWLDETGKKSKIDVTNSDTFIMHWLLC